MNYKKILIFIRIKCFNNVYLIVVRDISTVLTNIIVITKKHIEEYIVKIKLQEESTLITLNKNDIHISLKDGLKKTYKV